MPTRRGRTATATSEPPTSPKAKPPLINPQANAPPSDEWETTGPKSWNPTSHIKTVTADCATMMTYQRLALNSFQPVRKAERAEVLLLIGWGNWIEARKNTDKRKVEALNASAHPGPISATTRPPSAGPSTFATFKGRRSTAFAANRNSGGTNWTIDLWEAGWKKAEAAPRRKTEAASIHSSATPARISMAMATCTTPETAFAMTITRSRRTLSPSTPPTRSRNTCGAMLRARMKPNHSTPPPASRAANATAIGAAAEPIEETTRPSQKYRNCRWCSTAEASLTLFTVQRAPLAAWCHRSPIMPALGVG